MNKKDKEKLMTEIIKKGSYSLFVQVQPTKYPWMGGALDPLTKLVKRSLKAITLDRIFTKEALYTFPCEVEPLLNNRPVTTSSNDINDYEAPITNHLILGNSLSNYSPCKCQNDKTYHRYREK